MYGNAKSVASTELIFHIYSKPKLSNLISYSMSNFELNDESAIDLLIFWVEGADGLINYDENREINHILEDLNYSPENFQHTLNHLNGLTTKHIDELVDKAVIFTKKYSEDKKRYIIALLQSIAEVDGEMSKPEREKLEQLRNAYEL